MRGRRRTASPRRATRRISLNDENGRLLKADDNGAKRHRRVPASKPDVTPQPSSRMPPPPSHCSGKLHQVEKNDTLHRLAEAHGVSLEAVLAANTQIKHPDRLVPGQVVCIPHGTATMTDIFNTLLTAERIEIALYSHGLVSPALEGLPPEQFAYFQAALSHEAAHANALMSLGASVPYTEFYYPKGTFEDREVFLNTILMIETAGVAAYTQASIELARMGRFDLARLADRIMGVEAEHRTLLRSVLGLVPANNLCFEEAPDEPVAVILAAVPNFLEPDQFDGASEGPIHLPRAEKVKELVGSNGCPNPVP